MISRAVHALGDQRSTHLLDQRARLRTLGLDDAVIGSLMADRAIASLIERASTGHSPSRELQQALKERGIGPLGTRLKVALALKSAPDHRNTTDVVPADDAWGRQHEPDQLKAVIRGDISALDLPVELTQPQHRGPDARAAAHVCERFSSSAVPFARRHDVAVSGKPVLGVVAGGDELLDRWTCKLSECGDDACTCCRTQHPHVRRRFRELIVRRTLDAQRHARAPTGGGGVRYASVGSGHCMFDFDVLAALRHAGAPIEQVTLVDPLYGIDGSARDAAAQLAAFFAPARVYVFERVDSLRAASLREPSRYGGHTVFVHCDAADLPEQEMITAAGACLAERGLAFQLTNTPMHATCRSWWACRGGLSTLEDTEEGARLLGQPGPDAARQAVHQLEVPAPS